MSWNQSQGKPVPPPRPSRFRGILAGMLVVVSAVGAYLAFFTSPASSKAAAPKPKAAPITEVKPAVVARPETNAAPRVQKPEKAGLPPFQKKPGTMQLPSGRVLTFPAPKEGETRKVFADGRLWLCDHLGNFKDITKRQLFHTAFEANFQALAVEGRTFIPAFLTGLDEVKVKELLTKNYQPIGDETEAEMSDLKAYDEMRCAALAYMEQGGKFDDFVNEYASFERKQRESRAMTLREVMTLYKQGDVAGAKEMAEAASVLLQKNGYKPLLLPPHVEKAFESVK